MFLVTGLPLRADGQNPPPQPTPAYNMLENPGFEFLHEEDGGDCQNFNVFYSECCQATEGTEPQQMFWWRHTGTVLCGPDGQQELRPVLVPIYEEGTDPEANIDFVEDGVRDGEVLHLRGPLAGEKLVYRRDPEQCGCLIDRTVQFDQWETGKIYLTFWARAAYTPQLRVNFNIVYDDDSTELIARDFTSFDPYGAWTKFTTILTATADLDGPVKSIDLSLELFPRVGQSDCDPPACDEVWLDDLYLYDGLQWTQVGGDPTHVQIHPEGTLFVNQEPFVPRILHDNGLVTAPDEIKQRYKEIGPGGGGDHGMEFNTVVAHPSFAWNYPTKRHLALMLASANSWNMKLLPYLPVYPRFEPRVPTSNDLVKDWVATFNKNPGLLGWIVADEITYHKVNDVLEQGQFLEAYEEGLEDPESGEIEYFHPAFLFTADDVFADGESFGNGNCQEPTGCLRKMLNVCHILLPNIVPIRSMYDEPMEIMSAVAAWCRTAADLYNDEKDWTGDTESSYRGTVGVIQFRPEQPEGTRPPSVEEMQVMSLQHVANGSLGLMYYDNHFGYSGDPDDLWDVLDPNSRAIYDARNNGAATEIYLGMPGVRAAIEGVMERKQLNLPPYTTSRHVMYLDGADVEDTWYESSFPDKTHHDSPLLETGHPCVYNCSQNAVVRFKDFDDKVSTDAADKIERAYLVWPVKRGDDCTGAKPNCPLGSLQQFNFSRTMFMRAPGGPGAQPDTIEWRDVIAERTFTNYRDDNAGYFGGGNVLDVALCEGVAQIRAFASNDPIIKANAWHYSPRLDISRIARFWKTYNGENSTQDLNNGLHLQGFYRTRWVENNVVFASSENIESDPNLGNRFRPHLVVYTNPDPVATPSIDFPVFDEVDGGFVEVSTLRTNDPNGVEVLAINNDDVSQCVKLFVPRATANTQVQVFDVESGNQLAPLTIVQQPDCDFNSIQDSYDFCGCPPAPPGVCPPEVAECQVLGIEDDIPGLKSRIYWIPRS
ncbi:MAG: hypothetical protein CME06_17565 [Gemmatimonadetes bacterium]|nr:hypothetical protein [Gemmatimonadota bacterium]